VVAEEKEKSFPSNGKNVTLISLQSGNSFPLFTENRYLCGGIHRESPWIDLFHFGNPIAKE